MKIKNQKFSGETIDLDYHEFEGCTFTKCKIVFHGYGKIGLRSCTFTDIQWEVADAAGNALNFLMVLYAGGGEVGMKLVEATFDNIRMGGVQPGTLIH